MPRCDASPWLLMTFIPSLNPQFYPPGVPRPQILLSLLSSLPNDKMKKILFHLIGRPSSSPQSMILLRVRISQHQGNVPLQSETDPEGLLNHGKRKTSTMNPRRTMEAILSWVDWVKAVGLQRKVMDSWMA